MSSLKTFQFRILLSTLFTCIILFFILTQNAHAASVNFSGTISASNSDNIWGESYKGNDTPYVSSGSKYNGQQVHIVQEEQTSYGTYYQFVINDQTIGWLDKNAFNSVSQVNYNNAVNYIGEINAGANAGIWGEPYLGGWTPYIAPGSQYNGMQVQIEREAQTTYGTYYQFAVNDKTVGWLDKSAFNSVSKINYNNAVNYTGEINAGVNAGIWGEPYLGGGTPYIASGAQYGGQQVRIEREAQTTYGTYYQFAVDGRTIGWLDKNAFSSINQVVYNNAVSYTGQVIAGNSDGIWGEPYLGVGTSYVASGSQYNGRQVQIEREAQTTYGTYYQFAMDGQTIGWLDKKAFGSISQVIYNNAVNYIGQVTAGNNDGIWREPYLGAGTSYVASGSQYNGRQVQIEREAQTTYGTYYQFAVDGQTIGWLDKNSFSSVSQIIYNNAVDYTGIVTAGNSDGVWGGPYLGGGTPYIGSGSQYNGRQVKIVREAQTTYGTYYQFAIGGQAIGWLDKNSFLLGDNTYSDMAVYLTGQITASANDGIWTGPYAAPGIQYVASGQNFNGKVVQIIHETQTDHGTYYLFQIDGQTIGWLDKNAFESVQNLDFTGIDLKKPSNVTAQDILNYFNARHPDSLLKNYAQDFINAQNVYGVNAQYLIAHAIWETGWGSSNLAIYKHNIYGYGAFDGDPFNSAYYFPTVQDCINYVASQIRSNYLVNDGKYYSSTYGATLKGMNEHYATDQNWSNGIASVMKSIEALDPAYYTDMPEISSVSTDTVQYGTDIPVGQPTP